MAEEKKEQEQKDGLKAWFREKFKGNLWFVLTLLTLFGGFALWSVMGLLQTFDYNGEVDANAIAVALVAVVSLIIGYVLGTKQNASQALLAPEDKPAPPAQMTESTAIEMVKIAAGNDK